MEQMSALHESPDRELPTGSTVTAVLERQAAWTEIQNASQDFISRNKLQTFLPRSGTTMYILLLIQKWLLIDFIVYDFRMNFRRSWEGAAQGSAMEHLSGKPQAPLPEELLCTPLPHTALNREALP